MKPYNVTLYRCRGHVASSLTVEVDARNERDAIRKAEDSLPGWEVIELHPVVDPGGRK